METSPEVLLGDGLQLQAAGEEFYVGDFARSAVYRFDRSGAFLSRIGTKGRGPEEFIKMSDFHAGLDKVMIFSDLNEAVYFYSPAGKFFDTQELKSRFMKGYPCQDGTFWLYWGFTGASGDCRLVRVDASGELIRKELEGKYNVLMMDESTRPVFSHYRGDTILMREMMNPGNVVYQIAVDEVSERYSFDFGRYASDEYFQKKDAMEAAEYLLSKDFAVILNFVENKDYALVEVELQKNVGSDEPMNIMEYGIKDKKNGRWHWFEVNEDDIMFGAPQLLTEKNELVCLVPPWKIDQLRNNPVVSNKEALARIEDDMNPVLLICQLK